MTDDRHSSNGPFGFGPEDFDRFAREAQDGLREIFGKLFEGQSTSAFSSFFDDGRTRTRRRGDPATAGDSGAGVWAVFVVDEDGGARVEQVYATELDALRAHQTNTDPKRRVRFLPYGIAVSALDPLLPAARDDSRPDEQ
ncbi:hypothetical protein QSJ18_03055 [Gordonia sp. ABSL1-1]|uniref:hypothetical protein n=1 Tax=Gordonia sp. ABSL1-1 TaxID=3053923 RepID=UPI002572B205|nr:hypothetical protein [Gordonia sp. ABSL1-1]MDL9935715.1 hypothetical protein [Gordonia sp. ABSL1-1]